MGIKCNVSKGTFIKKPNNQPTDQPKQLHVNTDFFSQRAKVGYLQEASVCFSLIRDVSRECYGQSFKMRVGKPAVFTPRCLDPDVLC